ncbi:hypothetical protein CF035_07925 [Klebsiella pneumoniae]|uniref:hypothetical protein n=1 Tax=Klebsiella pneumoniae TaxID=573 RepID=UPI001C7E4050|nr:hypothetical protein [Klebsiella pneumoniae]
MNVTEIKGFFHCDCGFSWAKGENDGHDCADGLREKLRQLAVENMALKKSERELDNTCAEEFGQDWVSELTETPATDRIVAEAEARGVEKFAAHLRANDNGASVCKMIALGADDFAKQLREGADK